MGGRWRRAGVEAALLWAAVGLAGMAAIGARRELADTIALLIIVAGAPILRWTGRRHAVRGRGDWARAAAVTFAALSAGIGLTSCVVALATYG